MKKAQEAKDNIAPFLDVEPPHWAARGLSYILILLFTTALLAALIIRVPNSVSSPFVLVPLQGTDPIRALYNGTIQRVHVSEGEYVQKDAAVFDMRSEDAVDRVSEYRSLETKLKGTLSSLENARRRYESQRMADQEQLRGVQKRVANLKRSIELKKQQLELLKDKAESFRKMFETGIISRSDYTIQQLETGTVAGEVQELQTDLEDSAALEEKLRHEMLLRAVEYEEVKRTSEEEIEQSQMRMGMLKTNFGENSAGELTIRASCSGTILRLQVNSAGAVVQDGDVLCELACSGRRLQAELIVAQSGVGLIKPGQGVKLLYDAFPYQRYGVKYGTVRWISPASVDVDDTPVFRVLVDVLDDSVFVSGLKRSLLPGMGGRAEVVVDRRALISYAFEPIRQLRENLKQPPPPQ